MAGRDLRALFNTNGRQVEACEAFTNWQGQWQIVQAALIEHLDRITTPGFTVEDLEAPRNNILVLHGVGGSGRRRCRGPWGRPSPVPRARPARWGEPV
ncbi:hypothetical protein [Streptomyces erythrochromogenes]|uniref:hypothetical protein n=1 Tax=Streptomyces erythrochromogenes TaxID=285574 RepID=UPI0036C70858